MSKISKFSLLAIIACLSLMTVGCATTGSSRSQLADSQRWFVDPTTEMGNYRTYGFLQVTAVRYQEPIPPKPKYKQGIFTPFRERKDPRLDNRYTDELIWRTLAEEMEKKGYTQVAPEMADVLVIYYGGPRPQTPPMGVKIEPHAFDGYFAQNELKPQTFFVDVLDGKKATLIYRGWDNTTFTSKTPEAQRVIDAAATAIGFFPSRQ